MRNDWMDSALCAQVDPDLWYPEKYSGSGGTPGAKKICGNCPVRAECLYDTFSTEEGRPHGIRGGLSSRERMRLTQKYGVPRLLEMLEEDPEGFFSVTWRKGRATLQVT